MSPNHSPRNAVIRTVLRVGGPILLILGLLLIAIGLGSFFSAFGSFDRPRLFWCAFLGMPVLFIGIVMCKFGYMGDVLRYFAEEASPVVKDTANYLGENTQPGVKAVAKAVAEGILEAQSEAEQTERKPP